MDRQIFVGSRVVGMVRGQTLFKSIQGSKHILRQPKAICSDVSVLEDAKQAGAVEVKIRDTESGLTYSAPLESFERFGFPVHRGFGTQTGLTLNRWTIQNGSQAIQTAQGKAQPAEQLAFKTAATPAVIFEKADMTEQLNLFTA